MSATPAESPPAAVTQPPSSHPTTLQLATYGLTALVVVGVIVLMALGKINTTAGAGLLGVALGHGGTIAAANLT